MSQRPFTLVAAVVALGALSLWWRASPVPDRAEAVGVDRRHADPTLASDPPWPARRNTTREARTDELREAEALDLPPSLAGTTPDGALMVDAAGRFVVNPETRAFFDYFLTTVGEIPAAALRARIIAEIEARLPEKARDDAIAFLDRYLDYRRRARRMAEDGEVPEDLRARFDRLREVRREALGDENAELLFGEEERTIDADLTRREILQTQGLSVAERTRLLTEVEQRLPDAVREVRARAHLPAQLLEHEQELRAAGGSPEEVHALRVQTVGEAAAERLAQLDVERAAWQVRLDTYRAERSSIENDPRLSLDERRTQVAALRERHFDATERLRLDAIERQ